MKKIFLILLFFACFSFALGCDNINKTTDNPSENPSNNAPVSIKGFLDNDDVFCGDVDNDVEILSFIDMVSVPKKSSWHLYKDISGTEEIISKTVSLKIGDNTFYMIVTKENGDISFYTICVRRLPLYKVIINYNNGSNSLEQMVQEKSLIPPLDNPTKEGYDFFGWDYDITEPVEKNISINALWKPHKITIKFDVNGGNALSKSEQEVEFGKYLSLPVPSRKGYSFNGWYYNKEIITSGIWKIDSDLTLTATWEVNSYSLSYNFNGGQYSKSGTIYTSYDEIVTYGESFKLLTPTRTGYTFGGWLYNDAKFEEGTWLIDGSATIVASWVANTYLVTYDVNGGNNLNENTQKVTFDSDFKYKRVTRDGYTFDGWYYGSIKIDDGKWTYSNDIQVVAHWSANSYDIKLNLPTDTLYKVKFDYNDGRGIYKEVDLKFGDKLDYEYPLSTNENTCFAGWFTDSNCENLFNYGSSLKKSQTLYAGWKKIEKTSSYIILNPGVKSEINKSSWYTLRCFVSPYSGILTIYGSTYYDICPTFTIYVNGSVYNKAGRNGEYFSVEYNNGKVKEKEISVNCGDVVELKYYSSGTSSEINKGFIWFEITSPNNTYISNPILNDSTLTVTYDQAFKLKSLSLPGYTWKGWYTEPGGKGELISSNQVWKWTKIRNLYAYFAPSN